MGVAMNSGDLGKTTVYLVFIGPFADILDKKMSDFRGLFTSLEDAAECAKRALPRDRTCKAQIHKCPEGFYKQGLNDRHIHASVWWDEGKMDWKILIPSQSQTNSQRARR